MGQKTNPIGLRLGIIRTWSSNWFDERNFADKLREDLYLRRYIRSRMQNAGISQIEIARTPRQITITIHTAKPGIVIGRKGFEVDKLKEELQKITGKDIQVNVNEIKKPELDAYLVGENVARQLEAKISFRRVMKKAITAAMRMGAEGIKITCKGRLAGAEMARTEHYKEGKIPLHTLRADIDYAATTAKTTYGCIGVKVWICKGEVIGA
ncbi:30S ribosomal protein S3 [candidate division KSB1 bacterium]|nr:MAG: 30S ribosomal protein S3 [candidate division KSB1 bacterium 4484_219]RKY79635.1 MAG: 30S ribosomal protein S3 [candidate division KSB1 bacterium]RKY81131.1 MAG: 30S ribosomal protein S3 [candidate division KSB1 bacterium]RKY89528.1 MAG: 30S ribosomal protein S3 [candidate division KSB1 bacterium]